MEITILSRSCSAVIDTRGAELKSFRDVTGDEYMWQADPAYWAKTSPVLFPNVGVLSGNKANIGGKDYPLRRHGFARDIEFKVMYQERDRAVFCLSSNEQTLQEYPFPFMLRLTYHITDCAVEIQYDVMNTGEQTMFYKIGAHPAFRCPVTEGDRFENYQIVFPEPETAGCPVMDLETQRFSSENRVPFLKNERKFRLDYHFFDRDALIFDQLKSRSVSLESILTGRGVQLDFEGFDTLGVWSPAQKEAPFVCLEPWAGCAVDYPEEDGTFERMHGIQQVEPTEMKRYRVKISLL